MPRGKGPTAPTFSTKLIETLQNFKRDLRRSSLWARGASGSAKCELAERMKKKVPIHPTDGMEGHPGSQGMLGSAKVKGKPRFECSIQ